MLAKLDLSLPQLSPKYQNLKFELDVHTIKMVRILNEMGMTLKEESHANIHKEIQPHIGEDLQGRQTELTETLQKRNQTSTK